MARLCLMLAAIVFTLNLAAAEDDATDDKADSDEAPARQPTRWPGVAGDGMVLLPNQWSLKPVGAQIKLGDFPVQIALHPTLPWAAVLHAGFGEHQIVVINLKTDRVVSRVTLDQTFYGICFDPAGKRLYASGAEQEVVHQFVFADGYLSEHCELPIGKKTQTGVPAGLTPSADGQTLYVANAWGHSVALLPIGDAPEQAEPAEAARAGEPAEPDDPDDPDEPAEPAEPAKPDDGDAMPAKHIALEKESYPYTSLPSADGKRLYVSLWGKASVAVIDLESSEVAEHWPTREHPTELVLSPDGERLFVACANSNTVSVLDTSSGQATETISSALYAQAPNGSTPNSLSLTPDGKVLFIANADNNNVAVFNVSERGKSRSMGFIPVGWYPTSVRYNPLDKRIYVANGKGLMSQANPQGPNPERSPPASIQQYIGGLFRGTLSIIPSPSPDDMARYSQTAFRASPLKEGNAPAGEPEGAGHPIPAQPGGGSPIKHCIYIVKENRTYDQVFGDMPEGNGDAELCIFPERVTPNQHALAREFVLLDNFYVESEVSADGHEWSMAAYATDFVEKSWPLVYRHGSGKLKYPSEGSTPIAFPSSGYIWDRCREAEVSYRSYGEFIDNGRKADDPGKATVPALEGHFDPHYRGYDLDYADVKRAARFIEELKRFEQDDEMPQFIVLRLPNDHTYGQRRGKPSPAAMVADNDLALGQLVEAVSKSKFWPETAIFVVEDDAQNGSDHVDAHRTVALAISPYCRRGSVDSSMYSTSSMLRTMELILGLEPMSQFDAAARPMYDSFQAEPDLAPYEHRPARIDLTARNPEQGWGVEQSARLDFSREDAADDLLLNEIIWRSVRGAEARMPPPVRASFVMVHPGDDDDDEQDDDD